MSNKNNSSLTRQILIEGVGSDTSIFRQLPWVKKIATSGLRVVPFAVPAAIAVAWAAYPALTPDFKKSWGIP